MPAALGAALAGRCRGEQVVSVATVGDGPFEMQRNRMLFQDLCSICMYALQKLDDGWPESEKGKNVDVKYIEERRRCEKISEERMNI